MKRKERILERMRERENKTNVVERERVKGRKNKREKE